MLAAGAGRMGMFFFFFFFFCCCCCCCCCFVVVVVVVVVFLISSILSSFSNVSSLGRLDILKCCGLGRYNPTVVVSYYWRRAR